MNYILFISEKLGAYMAHRKAGIYLLIISLSALTLAVNSADIEKGLFLYLPIDEGTGGKVQRLGPQQFQNRNE